MRVVRERSGVVPLARRPTRQSAQVLRRRHRALRADGGGPVRLPQLLHAQNDAAFVRGDAQSGGRAVRQAEVPRSHQRVDHDVRFRARRPPGGRGGGGGSLAGRSLQGGAPEGAQETKGGEGARGEGGCRARRRRRGGGQGGEEAPRQVGETAGPRPPGREAARHEDTAGGRFEGFSVARKTRLTPRGDARPRVFRVRQAEQAASGVARFEARRRRGQRRFRDASQRRFFGVEDVRRRPLRSTRGFGGEGRFGNHGVSGSGFLERVRRINARAGAVAVGRRVRGGGVRGGARRGRRRK
mmetsp:Transcript_1079/g.4545  ORF Transcript_1079/g.4545 Transcript_1079/m.4545 type:complete len:298 (+) Transcript_1079:1640-2533(+)